MAEKPEPLVPAEVDLRGMEYMPLKGDVLFKSTTWLKGSHEARCAALRLWWHSFGHEVPAASLPDDDQLLAEHAGYGEVMRAWLKIKPQAMRGWVLCSDGRWYHRIVAELALEAWKGRVRNRDKVRAWREKRAGTKPDGNQSGNGNGAGPVTVTGAVTRPLRNRLESESESKLRIEKKEHEAPAKPSPQAAPDLGSEPEPETDVKSAIFGPGLRWLVRNTGGTESASRSFLGQLIAQHGEAKTASVLMAAERAKPVDPRSWMKRNIEGGHNGPRPRNGSGNVQGVEGAPVDGIAAAFARRSVPSG